MKFTGERYVPTEQGRIRLEHYHRYAMVLDVVKEKDVLDVACGEGYGSSFMADVARSVVGVDISGEAVQHASATYTKSNLTFRQGSAIALNFADASFDVVVSFETIEHLAEQAQMLAEIRQVLRPNGVLVISSPNRPIYSEESGERNEFHVKELDFKEFDELLRTQFRTIQYFGQRMLMGSVIQPFEGEQSSYRAWYDDGVNLKPNTGHLVEPVYFVAICRADKGALPNIDTSVLYPDKLDLVKHYMGFAKWAQSLERAVAERDRQIAGLNQAVQTLTETVAEKEQQTTALTGQLCEITISKAWRMAMMMRSIRVWLAPPTSWRARLLRRMLSLVLFPFKIRQNWRIARDLALIRASNLYDELCYLANNPDVAQAGVDPARHYLRHGGFEGRSPGPNFSSAWYLDAYEDVKKAGINPLIHYLKQGREEGRHPNLENNDIALIRSSGLFDEAWYLANNPDVAQAGVDPARHYLRHGGFEGFDPGTDFSSAWYLDTYCDVRISGENPLVHFLRYGRAEGRDPKPQKLTTAVRASLQNILKRLDISCTANEIISALGEYGNYIKTRQIMANIVEVETFLSAAKNKEVYSLIHAAQLPEASPNTRKKNILFITSEFPDPYHGGGNRVLNFIESLSKHNNVYLCAAFCQSEHEIHLPPVEKYCRSILKIPYENYGGNQEEIREWLNGLPMDIVHYEWLFSLKNYAPDFGKHQIFTYMEAVCLRLLMDMGRLIPLSKEWLDKFEQLSNALQFELVLAAPLHTRIAVTSKDGEFFKKLFPFQEYAVLNHGLNFENFTLPDVEPEPQTLVFVGNYKHYPNADAMHFFFGKIWEDIRNEMPETRIYVVGTTPPSELLQMADGKNIIVTGAVPDVRPYIQKASVCIAPLVTGAGLRGKVIEYAALRRAFVATSIATTDLNFKDGIDYFCADQPAEFSQRIISLLKNPELARQMADSAYHTARENYGTERLTGYLLSLYQYLENQSNAR
jgi:SAM-dependent methyltransferase/glycosyltransferase involved in cell wall biosynthesis